MGLPEWWAERRFGVLIRATTAAVPAWAPIGQHADAYRWLIGGSDPDADDVSPMVEALAHHRDRWGHIAEYDDFLDLMTFDRFDAEEWARLAEAAGAGYAVVVARDVDGVCWWDAPDADRTVVDRGPKRDVLAEFAAACERNDLILGIHDAARAGAPLPRLEDLADRYGVKLLCADHRVDASMTVGRAPARADDVLADDRVVPGDAHDGRTVVVYDDEPPADIVEVPWELRRCLGASRGLNRNERPEHLMTGFDIVALLTEVVAKGGNLQLAVGASADGSIPADHAQPLRDAGSWIRAHHDLLARATPWRTWGDADVRYLRVDDTVHVVDVSGRGRFASLVDGSQRVTAVDRVDDDGATPINFAVEHDAIQLDVPRRHPWRRATAPGGKTVAVAIDVYRITLTESADADQTALFETGVDAPTPLRSLLDDAHPGQIVQLGEGRYCGPGVVPDGVIVRGLGPKRTTIEADSADRPAVTLGQNSKLEHLAVSGDVAIEGTSAGMLGCWVDGEVRVHADDVLVRASRLRRVRTNASNRSTVSRCELAGTRHDDGIVLDGGHGHDVDSCEFVGHRCAVAASDTTDVTIRGNDIEARWWGVRLHATERSHVHGNRFRRTMRAVDIDGGTSALVDGNAVLDGDSGCVVEFGAADCEVSGNHWERCRIGLIAWETTGLRHHDNQALSLHEPDSAVVTGP